MDDEDPADVFAAFDAGPKMLAARIEHDPQAGASYAYLFNGETASTVEARSDINVDISAGRTVLGVEVIGDADWTEGLVALAMTGRLRVAPVNSKSQPD